MIEHQLTALSDVGMIERGDALPEKIKDLQAYIMFGTRDDSPIRGSSPVKARPASASRWSPPTGPGTTGSSGWS